MEEGRVQPNVKPKQVMYVSLKDNKFLKGLKLGDKGYVRASGEVISERADERDMISKLIRINKIKLMQESRRV